MSVNSTSASSRNISVILNFSGMNVPQKSTKAIFFFIDQKRKKTFYLPNRYFLKNGLTLNMFDVMTQKAIISSAITTANVVSRTKL